MKKSISVFLSILLLLSVFAVSVSADGATPASFGWGSDTANWDYWTTEDAGTFALLDWDASCAAGGNCRVWKNILVDSTFTWSFDLKVDTGARAYINLLGLTLEAGVNADGGYWIPQTGTWLTPADGYISFVVTREDGGDLTVTATPTGGAAYTWTMTPASETAAVEIGMWNHTSNGFAIRGMTYTNKILHKPDDYGWGSDTANWDYWTADDAGSIALLNCDASHAAGANCRAWKDILTDSTFTWSFDLKVGTSARVYINLLGLTLEAGVDAGGAYWIPQIGNWLTSPDRYLHYTITRDGGDITVSVAATDGTPTTWTMTPTNEIAAVEIGMWNSANNGFEIRNMTYTAQEAAAAKIESAYLTLNDNIDVTYSVAAPTGCTNAAMTFVMNGVTTTVSDYTAEDGKYLFTFTGVTPQHMADNISATFTAKLDGEVITDTVAEYSIKQYCANQLEKYADNAKLVTLLSDLLTYGAAAQTYTAYNTDALATDGLTLTPSTFTELAAKSAVLAGTGSEAADWSAATLTLSNALKIRLYFKAASVDGLTVTAALNGREQTFGASDFAAAGEGKHYVEFDGIKATEFNDALTASFAVNGEAVGRTISYSVNTYISSMQNVENASLQALVRALYNYGAAAAAYSADESQLLFGRSHTLFPVTPPVFQKF